MAIETAPPPMKPVALTIPRMHQTASVGITYAWKDKARVPVKPEDAARELGKIADENHGTLMPATVVNRSRPAKSPLHDAFEWDDSKAAEQYRLSQAYYLIRSLVVRVETTPGQEPIETRAYVPVRMDGVEDELAVGHRAYVPVDAAMQHREWRQQVLAQAVKDLDSWRRKYETLEELSEVFAAVDRTIAAVRGTID